MFVDTAIARRLELASIWRSIRYANAKARIEPDTPLAIEAVGDGFAVFAGVEAPVNAAGGLGMTTPVARQTMDTVEDFFRSSLATEMRTILAPNFYSESAAIFLAEIDGQAVGGGAMYVHDGVVEFGSTSTLPNYRRRGVQTALLDARLKLAQEMGCDLAMVITSPGTASQRNVMRLGFELAYTKAAIRGEGRLTTDDRR